MLLAATHDSDAIYDWNLPYILRNESGLGSHCERYPFGLWASRAVLARRYGIAFDVTDVLVQGSETFTWLECVECVNFYLSREADLLMSSMKKGGTECERDGNCEYDVYQVIDSQKSLYEMITLSKDEPTHFIHQLIEIAFQGMSSRDMQWFKKKYRRGRHHRNSEYRMLFDMLLNMISVIPISVKDVLNVCPRDALSMLCIAIKCSEQGHCMLDPHDATLFLQACVPKSRRSSSVDSVSFNDVAFYYF